MWNDTDIPKAYFITFRTYGSWLHGDERGSINRHHNIFGTPKIKSEPTWLAKNHERLKHPPVVLNATQRRAVKKAIKQVCKIRGWGLLAINVRTNHVHVVVTAQVKIGSVLNALKANATRQMREDGCWDSPSSPWNDKGSTRYLWNDKSVGDACSYVEYDQGDLLPDAE